MPISYPGSLDNFANPAASDTLAAVPHATQHDQINDAVEAIEAKLGIGAGVPALDQLLVGTAAGTASWQGLAKLGIGASAAAERLLKKLYRNDGSDAMIVFVGDSTVAMAGNWPSLLATSLGTRYPAYTVKYAEWNDTTKTWPAWTTIQTGTGTTSPGSSTGTLYLANAAVSGKNLYYHQAWVDESLFPQTTLPITASAVQPDLVLVAHGHNEAYGTIAGGGPSPVDLRARMVLLLETIKSRAPNAGLIVVLQNERTSPATDDSIFSTHFKHSAYINAAEICGAGVIDAWQAYHDTGNPAAYLGDGIHPNTAGMQLYRDLVMRVLEYRPDGGVVTRPQSSFFGKAQNLLANGDFASFVSPPTLPNWTASNATLSKNTTNFESANGYSVRLLGTGNNPYIVQTLPTALTKSLRGQWVTFAVRWRIVAGTGTAAANMGKLGLYNLDGALALISFQFSQAIDASARDRFVWESVTFMVDPAAAYVAAYILPDSGNSSTVDVSIDRAILVPGILPRDTMQADPAVTALTADYVSKSPIATQVIQSGGTAVNPLVLRGAAGQTAALMAAQTSDSANMFQVTPSTVAVLGPSLSAQKYSADAFGQLLLFQKSRNPAAFTHTVVQNNDILGRALFQGSDGAAFQNAADIRTEVDGTPGAADMPGRLMFGTTPAGAAAPLERLRITNTGAIVLGAGGTGPQILQGSGSPEGVYTAPKGSTYQRTDGGAGTSYYVKESGAGNTGWVAK